MGLVFGLFMDAALLGVIVAVLEKSEFPGWGPMIGCAFGVGIATTIASMFLPGLLSILGLLAGALVGGFLLQWVCGMTARRGMLACGIYFGIRLCFSLVMYALTR